MEITPGESWTWSYRVFDGQQFLGLNFTADNGHNYFFKTNFMVQRLQTFPEDGQPFSVHEAMLLNAYMEGLSAIGMHSNDSSSNVSTSMEISLNAVACAQFVRVPKRTIEFGFIPYPGHLRHIALGQVVSLYSKDNRISDFIVLDEVSDNTDSAVRLMFANREFKILKHMLMLGASIKVPRSVICPFRGTINNQHSMSYA